MVREAAFHNRAADRTIRATSKAIPLYKRWLRRVPCIGNGCHDWAQHIPWMIFRQKMAQWP
jgi:hypothetical protein